jgi:glycosyltransferase involved in cell wall biosynthesis
MMTVGLCMIVKNEINVITRCLDSVRPMVDYVLIEDTGSTDGTQQFIADWLQRNNMPGTVIEEPWRDFAYNRSHVMEKLREIQHVDYALIIDADDRVMPDDGFDPATFKTELRHDLYDIQIRHGGSLFYRPQLCANKLPFRFKAVLHEYLEAPPGLMSRATVKGFYIETGRGGARNQNPRKYHDDAAILEKALLTETDPFLISRYTFYLAQSYKDCGERENALVNYLKRAELGYWVEEVFESLYSAAKLKEALGFPAEEVIAAYLRATDAVPTRAEALHALSRFCRSKGRNEEGFQYAKRGLDISLPNGGLFVERWVYDWGLLDELAINGYWSGHHREALNACLRLLEGTTLPPDQRERVVRNARFSLEKLPCDPNLGSLGQSNLSDQHALVVERPLRSRVAGTPKVMLAILAKQKERMLPLYLERIEALDYPKSSMVLYIRTNNNTDGTERILREWIERVGHLYAAVEFDAEDVAEQVQQFGAHEWNATRFRVLGRIRNISLRRALENKCDFYFVADVDNFIRACTLRELLALNLPIVAPLLRSLEPGKFYSNYHAEVDSDGYYRNCDQYQWILNRWIRGVIEVPVVHTTYLVRADVIPDLNYEDVTSRHEYVVFSDNARRSGVAQYLDNRQVYGYIAFDEGSEHYIAGGPERARTLLSEDLKAYADVGLRSQSKAAGIHVSGSSVDGKGSGNAGYGVQAQSDQPDNYYLSLKDACSRNTTKSIAFDRKTSCLPTIANKPRVFICFGLHRSGSTWMFNLVRDICRMENKEFISCHRESEARLPQDITRLILVKSHNPMRDMQIFSTRSDVSAIITVRDPRDSVASMMQQLLGTSAPAFEEAARVVSCSARSLVDQFRIKKFPVFRYEDGFIGDSATFTRIATLLGTNPSDDRRQIILDALTSQAVRRTISDLEAAGIIRGNDIWDVETHWHANHIGNGKVGKFKNILSPAQQLQVVSQTRAFCECFGYDTSVDPSQEQHTAALPTPAEPLL